MARRAGARGAPSLHETTHSRPASGARPHRQRLLTNHTRPRRQPRLPPTHLDKMVKKIILTRNIRIFIHVLLEILIMIKMEFFELCLEYLGRLYFWSALIIQDSIFIVALYITFCLLEVV